MVEAKVGVKRTWGMGGMGVRACIGYESAAPLERYLRVDVMRRLADCGYARRRK